MLVILAEIAQTGLAIIRLQQEATPSCRANDKAPGLKYLHIPASL